MQHEPDLNLLILLDAVLSEGSVTGAARRLNLSVPAASRGLDRARRALGDPLMVRAGRGLVPTPRALAMQERIHEVVSGARLVMRDPGDFIVSDLVRDFRIMASDLAYPIAHLIGRIHRDAPKSTCAFFPLLPGQALRDSDADLVIGVVRDFEPVSNFEQEVIVEPIRVEPIRGIARADHPMLAGGMTLEKYLSAYHLVNSRQGRLFGPIDHELEGLGRTRRVVASTATLWATVNILLETDLLGAVSEHVARTCARFGLVTFPLPFATTPSVELCQAWHPRNTADPAHSWLRQQVRELATAED